MFPTQFAACAILGLVLVQVVPALVALLTTAKPALIMVYVELVQVDILYLPTQLSVINVTYSTVSPAVQTMFVNNVQVDILQTLWERVAMTVL